MTSPILKSGLRCLQNSLMEMSTRSSGSFSTRTQERPSNPNYRDSAENSLCHSGCGTIVWTKKTIFSRHQEIDRNSSILCFSFTASFYPLEISLLIILICFCFNCFSGLLFTSGWNMQIPLPLPLLCPQTTLLIGLDPVSIDSRWPTVLFST